MPIARDGEGAKQIVASFLSAAGYDSVDAGSLVESWRMEAGSPIDVWPYAAKAPEGLSAQDANAFYMNTSGKPLSATTARELLATARRPSRVCSFPEELPPDWTRVVGWYADFLREGAVR